MSKSDKRTVNAVHTLLRDRFPKAFPKDYDAIRPLKTGIHADLIQRLPEIDPGLLRRALANHTDRDGYRLALLHHRGDRRYDLDGQPVGTVTEADRAEAARLLEASTQRGQAKVERVRTHKKREDKHRQQREIERRNREAKAARKAEHERAARGHQGPRPAPGRRSPRPRVTSGYRIVPTPPPPPAPSMPHVEFRKRRRFVPPDEKVPS
ncbi:MAG TPA: ProQ/FinO family protein [Candidatus Competibacteraceae bacterium]|nr:ProQ/FinO family protein [Candidatus Competibacteraceae bacterium]